MPVVEITAKEKKEIKDAVSKVYHAVMQRCQEQRCRPDEISSAAYSIQDFLQDIDCNEDGLRFNG